MSETSKEGGGKVPKWVSSVQTSVDNSPFMVRQIRVFGGQDKGIGP